MSLEPNDAAAVQRVRMLIEEYLQAKEPPAMPFARAAIKELGGDWEARGHEVAIGYLEKVLGIAHTDVGWLMAHPMALPVARRAYESVMNPDPRIRLFEDEDRALLRKGLRALEEERPGYAGPRRGQIGALIEALGGDPTKNRP